MSVRNLDAIFRPKSVALIGASNRPHSVGAVIARNLLAGGFDGPVMPVNPQHGSVAGVLCYPDAASLPMTPDLAVICTPPQTVPGLIAALGARGTRGAIVVTAGFREAGNAAGRKLDQDMLDAARPHLMRIIGPNCIGVLSTPVNLNASFAHGTPRRGKVAFVAQSGAMVATVMDWAGARGLGFSHLVSLGDMADVDFGDVLDYLAGDPDTDAILLYVEGITQARKFLSAARAAARLKPIVAIKAGRQSAAAKAAASHTGALAGIDAVYDAAFQRAGILRAYDLDEVFDAVETLAMRPNVAGDRLAILTNGGGIGVLATDALIGQGGRLAELAPETLSRLDALLPPTWSHANPVDIIGDADGRRYAGALAALLAAPEADAILILHCPTAIASGLEAAKSVIAVPNAEARPVLISWLGSSRDEDAGALFDAARLPSYDTPEKAVRGFIHLVRYRRGQEQLMEVPPAGDFSVDEGRARRAIAGALGSGDAWLDPVAVQELFEAYRIPIVRSQRVATAEDAAATAQAFGGTVALKIVSPDITHKSDVGGVVLDLVGADATAVAARAMLARVAKAAPAARLQGFLVQEMIRRPGAYELILGMASDATFGPFLLFGQGGVAVEQIADKALALPPLNLALAREMISRTRIYRQLKGYRDRPPVALEEVAATLVKLSRMICDLDAVIELDVNPLLADDKGVIAVDARVRVAEPQAGGQGTRRLAIRPYPGALACRETLGGVDFVLRPVRPEDAPAFVRFFARLEPEDIRLRFLAPLQALSAARLARLTQIDYDREMALVLFDAAQEIAGIARIAADPDSLNADFAVIVRSDLKGRGIGRLLLQRLIAYARQRGIGSLTGDILKDNARMLALCSSLDFAIAPAADAAGVVRARLVLQPETMNRMTREKT